LGVWALVIQSVGYSFFKMCFIWYYGRWKPGGHFKIARLKEMFPFSSRVMLTSLINAVFNNLLYLIIGRFYQVTQLGYYTQANKYQEIPNSLVSYTFRNIAIPLLSSVNHEDERLERILHKLVKTAAFFTFPVFFGLILIAKPLFIVLITEKWLASVPIFQILCISGVFNVFNYLFQEAILSKGHSKAILYLEIFKRALFVGLILLTIKKGVLGLAAGWTISSLLSTFLSLLITNRLVHYRIRDFIKDSLPYFVLSLVLCLSAALLFRFISQPWILLISSITGVALLYLFISYQLHLEAANETFSWLRDRWHRKQS
jgi:O-antigen/teichoic acid export membrane protein